MSGTWADAGLRVVWTDFPEKVALPQALGATLLLDLEADTLSLNDGDPVSLWSDQSGNGHDFMQTGSVRPTKQTIGGYPVVDFDHTLQQWMDGGNFADNLPAFCVFAAMYSYPLYAGGESVLIKETDAATEGWEVYTGQLIVYQDPFTEHNIVMTDNSALPQSTPVIYCIELDSLNPAAGRMFFNGVDVNPDVVSTGIVTNYSTSGSVKIGYYHDHHLSIYSILIYQITDPAKWTSDRDAIHTWIAARYGITL